LPSAEQLVEKRIGWLVRRHPLQHYDRRKRNRAMQRTRAIAIAAADRKARQSRLIVAASLLLLPAALLLLLISP
jgi:hypothetical protein